jgi:hypothetical protein
VLGLEGPVGRRATGLLYPLLHTQQKKKTQHAFAFAVILVQEFRVLIEVADSPQVFYTKDFGAVQRFLFLYM